MGTDTVSVIVPAYNEGENIVETLERLSNVQGEMENLEIIVVDDCSEDDTSAKVARFANVKYVRHLKNMGKGAALDTGFRAAIGEVLVVQDADLEYSPERIPELVKPILNREADVVYGTRMAKGIPEGMTFSHYAGNRILSLVTSLVCGIELNDVMTGYKAFRRKIIGVSRLESRGFGIEIELTIRALSNGNRFGEIPLEYRYRQKGSSKICAKDGILCLLQLLSGGFRLSRDGADLSSKSTVPSRGIQLLHIMKNSFQLLMRSVTDSRIRNHTQDSARAGIRYCTIEH